MAELKLTNDLIDKAHRLISEGHYAIVVCTYLGISEASYYNWLQKAKIDIEKNKKTIYVEFLESIKEAESKAEMRHLQSIAKASADGTWQASAWFLERKHKDRWSTKQEVQLSGDEEKPILVKLKWD
jgi:hypothetical protein